MRRSVEAAAESSLSPLSITSQAPAGAEASDHRTQAPLGRPCGAYPHLPRPRDTARTALNQAEAWNVAITP